LQGRVQSLRLRAGQLAGFAAAVVALVGGNANRILGPLSGAPRDIAGITLLAATILLVLAMGSTILGAPFRPQLVSDISGREIANYATTRFTHEPDLWRIHIRTIKGLLISIDNTTKAGDRAVATLRRASFFFLMACFRSDLPLLSSSSRSRFDTRSEAEQRTRSPAGHRA
jgi:hypothetical protein